MRKGWRSGVPLQSEEKERKIQVAK